MENFENPGFSFDLPKGNSSIIKVIGVGGGGNNALTHMYEKGIHGVDFIICNTDAQTLDNNPVSNKVQLGVTITEGLGAGADPEVGEKSAIESIDDIKAALGQNTKMVFITAGMGGGTGTGAAPVIAKIAKEMGILTVGIVTVPFSFEGKRRLEQAESGLEKLRNNVDSLIVINNDKLRQQFGNLGFKQGFSKADEVLTNAAKGMAEVITAPFSINIDFRDAKSVLENSGTALMSTGMATGEKRAEEAVRKALDSPLLNDNKITGAKDVLLLIQSGEAEEHEATMDEIGLINDYIQSEAGNTANIIFGVGTDPELGETIKVLVIATGFAKENHKHAGPIEKVRINLNDVADKPHRESPFKTRNERYEEPQHREGRDYFRLDDDETPITPQFRSGDEEKKMNLDTSAPDLSFTPLEEPDSQGFSFSTGESVNLFSLEHSGQEPVSQSFAFEGEKPAPNFTGGNQLSNHSFSFTVNDVSSSKGAPKTEPAPEYKTPQNTLAESKQPLENLFVTEQTVTIETKTVEEVRTETVQTVKEEDENGFTFISNTTVPDEKVLERRNKLKEFNSRYQATEQAVDFENVPAYKRKNLNLGDDNASSQYINNYASEDGRGDIQIRENRFLNKDVD